MRFTANDSKNGDEDIHGWWHDIAVRLLACGRYYFSIYEY